MTYEEAKMQIQAIPEKIWDQLSEPDREAMDMAFSALQAQDSPKPTAESVQNVQNEDLISRKAAIDAIEKNAYRHTYLDQIIDIVSELPSAQPEIEERTEEFAQNVPKEDLISRKEAIDVDALIEFIENRYEITWKNDYEGGIKDACTDILEKISKMPTIEPERKKGKWIPQDFNTHSGKTSTAVYFFPKCSVCGNSADYTNYCPACGADMRG